MKLYPYNRFAKTPLSQSGDEGGERFQASAQSGEALESFKYKKTAASYAPEAYKRSLKVNLSSELSRFPYRLKKFSGSSHQQIAQILVEIKPDSVLDLGCGKGFLYQNLDFKIKNLIGVDLVNFENLKGYNKFYQQDLEKDQLKFGAQKFQAIVLGDVLEHLKNPGQLLKKSGGLLKPGGTILISVPNSHFWPVRILTSLVIYPKMEWGPFDKTHLHFFHLKSLEKLVTKTGFRIKRVEYTPVPMPMIKLLPAWQRPFFRIFELSNMFYRFWPDQFAYQIIVEATNR